MQTSCAILCTRALSSLSNLLSLLSPILRSASGDAGGATGDKGSLVVFKGDSQLIEAPSQTKAKYTPTASVIKRMAAHWPRPEFHAPWKNYRVISGHLGWVRSVAVDSSNEFFVTGSADRTIKARGVASILLLFPFSLPLHHPSLVLCHTLPVSAAVRSPAHSAILRIFPAYFPVISFRPNHPQVWDLATGTLKLTLTGHIEQVTGAHTNTPDPPSTQSYPTPDPCTHFTPAELPSRRPLSHPKGWS